MTKIKYTVTGVNLDTGVIVIDVFSDINNTFQMTIGIRSVAVSDNDTVAQLKNNISQVVKGYYESLFPQAVPKPCKILELVGKISEISDEI